MPTVKLTDLEMRLAAEVGVVRRLASRRSGLRQAAGLVDAEAAGWHIDVLGAMGEMAFAKYAGVYWTPSVGTFKLPDVGTIHVRTTPYENGRLIVRDHDPEGVYALMVANPPVFEVAGWITASAAKVSIFRVKPDRSRPECFAVPRAALQPVDLSAGAAAAVRGYAVWTD